VWLRRDEHGRQRLHSRVVTGSLQDAISYRDLRRAESLGGELPAPSRMTLSAFIDDWLTVTETRLRVNTIHDYRWVLRRWLPQDLAKLPVQGVRPLHIQRAASSSSTANG